VTDRTTRLGRYLDARRRRSPRASTDAFETLVGEAVDALPEYARDRMENVAILVEEYPSRARLIALGYDPEMQLLGLYEGIPRPQRGSGYHLTVPDRITLFRKPILAEVGPSASRDDIVREIRATILHEVAHHFGIDDHELDRLEGRRRDRRLWNRRG
jgi:predicted Zn-dependent protease with MMP-like domain